MTEQKNKKSSDLPVGEILQESWDLFSKNLSLFIVIVLIGVVMYLIPAIIGWLGGAAILSTGSLLAMGANNGASLFSLGSFFGSFGLILLLIGVISLFISTIYLAATNYAVYNVVSEKKVEAWDNFKLGFKKFWIFLGMSVVVFLIVGVGMILLVIPGIVAAFFLSFSFYLLIVENLSIGKAISRSFELVKNNWLIVLVMSLIVMAISTVLNMIPFVGIIASPLMALFATLVIAVIYKRIAK